MGTDSLTLTLPMPPNIANNRGHSRWEGSAKKRWLWGTPNALGVVNLMRMSPPLAKLLPATPFERVTISATLYVWARMDDDNAVARLKWPLDALKHAGFIVDDKRPWCRLLGIPVQKIDRKHQRIELVLSPLSEGEETI